MLKVRSKQQVHSLIHTYQACYQVLLNNKIVNRTTTTFEHMFDLICIHNKVC